MTRLAFLEKMIDQAEELIRIAGRLPSDSSVEVQPYEAYPCDEVRQFAEQLWRRVRDEIVAHDRASPKNQP